MNNIDVRLFFDELLNSRNVIVQLTSKQLVLRYRRTELGFLWSLLNPLLMMTVMALVFSSLFKVDLKTFAVFLFTGMIPWIFFSSVVMQSCTSLINNESLIKKIYLPKIIFPLSVALSLLVDSSLSFIALFALVIAIGGGLSPAIFFIPLAYIFLFFFAFGIGLITSVATAFFRDLQYIIQIAMQGLFYLTPIFYKHDSLGGVVAWLVRLNPVVPFIELFRTPLYMGKLPSASDILHSGLLSLSVMVVGLYIFLLQEKKIVFRL